MAFKLKYKLIQTKIPQWCPEKFGNIFLDNFSKILLKDLKLTTLKNVDFEGEKHQNIFYISEDIMKTPR